MLSSARMRRRLAWAGTLAATAGLIVFLAVVVFPSSKPGAAEKISNKKADIVHTPRQHHLAGAEVRQILKTAHDFIATAVRRKHLALAWNHLVAPSMKVGLTKREWDSGTAPFPPYPADVAKSRWNRSFSYPNEFGLRVVLFPRPHSKVKPVVWDVVLRKYGHRSDARWLVSSFTPAPSASGDYGGGGSFSAAAVAAATRDMRHTSAIWLFLPLGIFGGLLLGLATFLIGRSWRNAALYRAYTREHQRSSWRPS
jgi:hypothetical protein